MIKHILQLTILSLALYYSFIDVVPVVYWILTSSYIIVGLVYCVFIYGLDTRASWIPPNTVYKLQSRLNPPYRVVLSALNVILITMVLIYTGNYYHLLYPLTLVGLWSSIHNYK